VGIVPEISQSVVPTIAVIVTDLGAGRALANESQHDKAVNNARVFAAIAVQVDDGAGRWVLRQLERAPGLGLDESANAAHSRAFGRNPSPTRPYTAVVSDPVAGKSRDEAVFDRSS
jgi:hypothetical protein